MLCALGVRSRSPALRSLGGVGRHCPAPNACARQAERTHCSGASCILNRAHAPAAQRLPISNFRPGCQTQVTLSQRIRPFSAIAGRMCHRRENPATAAGTKDQSTNQGSDSGTSFAENDEKPKDYGTGVVGTFNRSIANYPAGMCGILSLRAFLYPLLLSSFREHVLARSQQLCFYLPHQRH